MIIQFKDMGVPNSLPEFLPDQDKFDTSFTQENKAEGNLRFPRVGNGNYPSKHPIEDTQGNVVGYLESADVDIEYTWDCIYSDEGNCFYLTSIPFFIGLYAQFHTAKDSGYKSAFTPLSVARVDF